MGIGRLGLSIINNDVLKEFNYGKRAFKYNS